MTSVSRVQWTFENLNINITHCNLITLDLRSSETRSSYSTLNFANSTFGSLHTSGEHKIQISDSYFDITETSRHPLVRLENSTLSMAKCSFVGKDDSKISPIVVASTSEVNMTDILVEHIVAENSLILMTNKTKLSLKNSLFRRNGHESSHSVFRILSYSSATVKHSDFQQNFGSDGSCFQVEKYSKLFIKSSHFADNVAIGSGGAIYNEENTDLFLDSCQFVNNSAWYIENQTVLPAGGGAVFAESSVNMTIFNTSFSNNLCINYEKERKKLATSYGSKLHDLTGQQFLGDVNADEVDLTILCQGGAIAATGAQAEIRNSTFGENYADYGGSAMSLGNKSNLTLDSSVFCNNTGDPHTGSIVCQSSCHLKILKTKFTNNTGVLKMGNNIGHSKLQIDYCLFERNAGHSILECFNTIINLQSSHFEDNGPIDGKYVQILQTGAANGKLMDNTLLDVYGSSVVSADNSTFINNTLSHIFNVQSGSLQLKQCALISNRASVIQLGYEVGLEIFECEILLNVVLDFAVVSCEGCLAIYAENSVFSANDARQHAALIKSTTPVSVLTKNCTFANNRHGLFSGQGMNIHIQQCNFEYSKWYWEDTQYNIIDVEQSNVQVVNSSFDIHPGDFIVIRVQRLCQMNFANTVAKGLIIFIITESGFDIDNCSLLEEGDQPVMSDYAQIQLIRKSRLNMRNTLVDQRQYRFIFGESHSFTNISDCTFNFTSSTNQIRMENSILVLSQTRIYWREVTLIHPWSNTDYLIQSIDSHVKFTRCVAEVSDKIFLLKFESSDVELDTSSFESGDITFINGVHNFLLVQNCSLSAATPLVIAGNALNVIANTSIVHVKLLQSCSSYVETVRLYNSALYTNKKIHQVNRLLVLNAALHVENVSLSSEGDTFTESIMESALFDNRTCPTSMQYGSVRESEYAAGKLFLFALHFTTSP